MRLGVGAGVGVGFGVRLGVGAGVGADVGTELDPAGVLEFGSGMVEAAMREALRFGLALETSGWAGDGLETGTPIEHAEISIAPANASAARVTLPSGLVTAGPCQASCFHFVLEGWFARGPASLR